MSALTRLLPLPSDRMGVLWNLLAIQDSYVIEYGPAGTTHFGIGPLGQLKIQPRGRYFVTHMDEGDVVMGDSSRLERAVMEIDRDHKPEHIFIVGSSISSTIGTDLEGIVYYLQDQVQAQLHIFDSGGFKGDMLDGMADVYKSLAELVRESEVEAVPASEKSASYNILGASPDHFRLSSDLNEIKRVLNEAYDLEAATTYVFGGKIQDFDRAAGAEFSLVLREAALPLAEALKEKYDVPYLLVDFYGYQGCRSVLEAIEPILGRSPNPEFMQELSERQSEIALFQMSRRRMGKELKLYSVGTEEFNRGLSLAFAELGLEFAEQIEHVEPETERLAKLAGWQQGLVFADSESLHRMDPSNYGVLTSFPWLKRSQHAEHLPFMGVRGMDFLYECLSNYIFQIV
ncbi:MAG: nitrogenase component 1 [Eubacteriales bacterium]|nr:nitrogenase component 1 [Eubacteriales bacterium]